MARRSFLAVALAASALLPLAPAAPAAGPTMTVESQAWWNKDGIVVPTAVGHHTHVSVTVPKTGVIVDGFVDVPYTVTFHDQVGKSNTIRWQDGSTTKKTLPLVAGACHDCTVSGVLPIDFSQFGTGLRELRISVNIPDEQPDVAGSQRMYQSFGIEVCVRACSPIEQGGRSLNFIEARGWYDDTGTTGPHGYQNSRVTSGIDSIHAGGTVSLKLAPGSGGDPTTFSGAFIDPKMHDGNAGLVLMTRNGSFQGSVTIPSDLAPGVHKFVALASDGKNAGVISIPFTVGDPATTPSPTPSPTPVFTPTPTLPPTPAPSVCGVP